MPLAWLFVDYQGWEFTLLDSSQVSNSLGWPAYQWMPDGHLSSLWVSVRFLLIRLFSWLLCGSVYTYLI